MVDVQRAGKGRVLVVEDDDAQRRSLLAVLEEMGYEPIGAACSCEAEPSLISGELDAAVVDLHLPKGKQGTELLELAKSAESGIPFIVVTGKGSIDTAVRAMKLGAFEFLEKPIHVDRLREALEEALARTRLRRDLARAQRLSGRARARLVGRSPAMERMWSLVERVAPTRANVLITGETGTGKELVARAVHELSPRASGPFVATNCSSLPETLLESELFGHVKGSFTGAVANRVGVFEEATGGSLFLDEVATLSELIQVKLLRVVQERVIQRVGGGSQKRVDFRLIAATNVDLAALVEQGHFREDLFYRLNVFPVRVPPLRERLEDIPLLAEHFVLRCARENGLEAPQIPAPVLRQLQEREWPGNVRELENTIERAVIAGAGACVLCLDATSDPRPGPSLMHAARDGQWELARLEKERILQVLDQTGGHRGHAARLLGIDRRTLYRKLKNYRATGRNVPA